MTSGAELYLVRHGRTLWNEEGRWQGQADPPLNAEGQAQAAVAADALAPLGFDAIYSSDLRRALATARVLGERLDMPVGIDPRLREIDLGAWQGLLSTALEERWPEKMARWAAAPDSLRPPGGETVAEVQDRVLAALDDIAPRHVEQRVAIFSHQLPIALVRCHALGLPRRRVRDLALHNAGWVHVQWMAPGALELIDVHGDAAREPKSL